MNTDDQDYATTTVTRGNTDYKVKALKTLLKIKLLR